MKTTKVKVSKFSTLKIISIVAICVLVIGGFICYKILLAQNTPKKAVEKYYNYIVKKDYDNAFKMMVGTDDRFLDIANFKIVMDQKNIKTFYIKAYNSNDFEQSYQNNNSQTNAQPVLSPNMFEVQGSGKLYPVSVIENGSKLVFFKDYKINADNLSIKWKLTAPTGAKILVNGKNTDIVGEPELSSENYAEYKPTNDIYQIDRIFQGSYNITGKMDGAKDLKLSAATAGTETDIKFKPNANLLKKLEDQTKSFINLYYSKASEDKYTSILTDDSDALLLMKTVGYSSNGITKKLQNIKITESQLDDSSHAKISVTGIASYNNPQMIGLDPKTGTKDITAEFSFEKINGKWLICDVTGID